VNLCHDPVLPQREAVVHPAELALHLDALPADATTLVN